MLCSDCGRKVLWRSVFCFHCGNGLAEAGTPSSRRQPLLAVGFTHQPLARLKDLRTVLRAGGGIALFALLFLPQVGMGQPMTAVGLLNVARDFDTMTEARDLFLWVWVLSVFGGAIWALASPTRLSGMVAGIVRLLFMARISGSQGLRLALEAYVVLAGFAVVALAPRGGAFASGLANEKGAMTKSRHRKCNALSGEVKEEKKIRRYA